MTRIIGIIMVILLVGSCGTTVIPNNVSMREAYKCRSPLWTSSFQMHDSECLKRTSDNNKVEKQKAEKEEKNAKYTVQSEFQVSGNRAIVVVGVLRNNKILYQRDIAEGVELSVPELNIKLDGELKKDNNGKGFIIWSFMPSPYDRSGNAKEITKDMYTAYITVRLSAGPYNTVRGRKKIEFDLDTAQWLEKEKQENKKREKVTVNQKKLKSLSAVWEKSGCQHIYSIFIKKKIGNDLYEIAFKDNNLGTISRGTLKMYSKQFASTGYIGRQTSVSSTYMPVMLKKKTRVKMSDGFMSNFYILEESKKCKQLTKKINDIMN